MWGLVSSLTAHLSTVLAVANSPVLAYLLLAMAILSLIFLICSIRTNVVFFMIFLTLFFLFVLLAGAFFCVAQGRISLATKLEEAAGAFGFVSILCGWYIFLAIMLTSVDFPFDLPSKSLACHCMILVMLTLSSL